jgi:hypothetical protein
MTVQSNVAECCRADTPLAWFVERDCGSAITNLAKHWRDK